MTRGRLAGAVAVLLVLLLGVGWYYSSQALEPGGRPEPEFDHVLIGGAESGRVRFVADDEIRLAVMGLLYPGGYGRITGDVHEGPCPVPYSGQTCVTRDFELLSGSLPQVDAAVDPDPYAFPPGEPGEALGVDVMTLQPRVPGGGTAPAWWVPPAEESGHVAVLVHGRGASRDEMLRVASILQPLGYGILIPSYRGDGVAPEPEDGLGRFGTTEWLDVAMAMLHAEIPRDARFVLVGYSQGGGLVASLLRHADVARRVDAAILDSPLLGLDATMQVQARLAGIPNVLVRPVLESAYLVSRLRGFDFDDGEHVVPLAELDVPILLFHGPDDTYIPVGPSEELVALDPDGVTYVRASGVDHVRFWNHDPEAYASAVRAFLDTHLG